MSELTLVTETSAGRRKKAVRLDEDRIGYVLIAPFYFFLLVFVLIPILVNLYLSFTNYDLSNADWVGLKNYRILLSDQFFHIALKNTFVYTILTLLFCMVIGLMLALVLNRKLIGLSFLRTGFFMPHITSMVAVSMIWLWIYEPSHGLANSFLDVLGIKKIEWLYNENWAMPAVIFMSIWKLVGYNMVIYLAGLQSIPKDLYEASSVDGAGPKIQFFKVTLPMLTPVTFFLFITGLIHNFNAFEQIQILTHGGPMNSTTTLVHQIYNRAFTEFQMGYAAALSMILLFIIAFITLANFKYGSQTHE
ncbi:carbohydrate ABC transporter permease [Paenibacillus radicis (ex Xue et al. 2023)]|uniref:Sugar ABC transporter permease n=1 Tax=Paenibacillus radicis (ex Xue et al. 2023) TaxID=2972489 RepID=A0ABT1YJ20_9BACL|nr:sugar ABC transporter permease [Paenibacillus radicis (ex Xue et al. 2023)]MCR8633183.1 sugar ABC transporter permease [Paenibacillus radicis (ex Xue et al. 2023)]